MRAAIVNSYSEAPRYGAFRDPVATSGDEVVRVRAVALSNLVKAQASGRHYSSGSELPLVPGNDGVGTLPDGRRVYFFGPRAPFGSMAEFSLAATGRIIPLPDALDDITAAALGNPGLASWGALLGRAHMEAGESVVVNGATGVAGQQAIQVAKYLGASRIVATGRNPEALEKLRDLGADETISLEQPEDALTAALRREFNEFNLDIVLDYLWGRSAEQILRAAAGHGSPEGEHRVRFVQIGSISGGSIPLEAHLLRSSGVELLGSGLGSLSGKEMVESLGRMFEAAVPFGLRIDTEAVPLSEVEATWSRTESGRRVVFTP
jgi:NADPH:quinone reductase-like Zn-dependent oxidoreductase